MPCANWLHPVPLSFWARSQKCQASEEVPSKGSDHQLPWGDATQPVIHRRGKLRLRKVGCRRQDPSACRGGHKLASVCTLCPSLIHGWEPTSFNFLTCRMNTTAVDNDIYEVVKLPWIPLKKLIIHTIVIFIHLCPFHAQKRPLSSMNICSFSPPNCKQLSTWIGPTVTLLCVFCYGLCGFGPSEDGSPGRGYPSKGIWTPKKAQQMNRMNKQAYS